MKLFVTVGSTGFDDLVNEATTSEFLSNIYALGFTSLLIQYGSSKKVFLKNMDNYKKDQVDIQGYDYKPFIDQDIQAADMVISHSGSGTILQALRMKKKLIVIVNDSLLDNHQAELAQAMAVKQYVIYGDIRDLSNTVKKATTQKLDIFPDPNPTLFASTLNKTMGFI
ncbi:glycosyl transferase [Halteromyces radiatus]|uniref:glycosyl transferase n=1 Tax=Halteromyces radiatus TaxID=101107 RepID=UPI00221E83EE|nr:glycosyl transferase [Halteromyces radiatus]KAI8098936.1 glycosyl transferase [Halteromyces radiatus]